MVGRQIIGKIAFVMAGSPADGAFEQPFADSLFWATTHLVNLAQQGGHMNNITEPSGQRRAAQSLNRFHNGIITWLVEGWRISFSAQNAPFPTVISSRLFEQPTLRHFSPLLKNEITLKTTGC